MIDFLKAVWITFHNRRAARLRKAAYHDAALAYNRLHTWLEPINGRHYWMCPTCNKVHESNGHCPFGGLLFPKCCGFSAGNAWYKATDPSYKLPTLIKDTCE